MSDERLRDLERRWRETGSPTDEGAYLTARLRAGDLPRWRYELAAYCGHEALGGVEHPPLSFDAWAAGLPFQGRRGRLRREWLRVPLAVARALAPVADRLGVGDVMRAALAVIEGDLLGLRVAATARAETRSLLDEARAAEHPDEWEPTPPHVAILWFADAALRFREDGLGTPEELGPRARRVLTPEGVWSLEPGVDAATEPSFPRDGGRLWALRDAVAADLVPWALGYDDPVRERPGVPGPPGGTA